jgi:hypothetical protein
VAGGAALAAVASLAALPACSLRGQDAGMRAGEAETVIYAAARVRTMDPGRPVVEAVAVRDGRIAAVGSRAELVAAAGAGARVVDLGAATVVPGLADAHAHLLGLGNKLLMLNLDTAGNEEAAVSLVVGAAASSRRGDWIVGRGWDQTGWEAGAFPTRAMLDRAFPDTPVFLTRVDGHAAWVNGEALRRAGITRQTPDPAGGRILRDASGEPTGILVDNAMDAVEAKLPPLTDEQIQARLQAALRRCAQVGLTQVHDAGMDLRTFTLLQQWDLAGVLPLRIYAMADGRGPDGDAFLERGTFKGRMLEMKGVKFWMDGALGSRGAALHRPYSDEPSQSGLVLWEPEALEARVRAFMERGFQVNVHAIGDRANTLTIDLLVRLAGEVAEDPGRHRVEHAQVLRLEDIPRLAKGGLIASMQPTHATSDMAWAEARLGPDRVKGAYAWRSLLAAGARLAFGSDFPVEEPDPLHGLYAARTRQDDLGKPEGGWLPEQRLGGEEALAGFTVGAAYASFAEEQRGMLKVGMDADLTALSEDPVTGEPAAVRGAKVLMTVVGGREVYRAE